MRVLVNVYLDKALDIVIAIEQDKTDPYQLSKRNRSLDSIHWIKFQNNDGFRSGSNFSQAVTSGLNKVCWRCLGKRKFGNCPAFHAYCNSCGLKGHYSKSETCKGPQNSFLTRSN